MILEMKDICKTFGAVQALKGVSFSVENGQIHGLLGENGAGKTTLMNVLAGTFAPDAGDILIDGTPVEGMTPRKAAELKIRFIHQELNLCNDLTVYQNMFLGEEYTTSYAKVDRKREVERAQQVLDGMNSGIDAKTVVADLDTAQKQMVEIARALLFSSELIIMDEPTTALNNREIEKLFTIMEDLKKEGVSFIYISHKMPEIFRICDRYTVLRDGQFVQSGKIKEIDEHQATELLIGKRFVQAHIKDGIASSIQDTVVLEARNLCGSTFQDVSFSLRKGEILVITGLQGSGTDELATALFGASSLQKGKMFNQDGELAMHDIRNVMKRGIGMIPRNRKERGILPDLSIRNNNSLAFFVAKHHKLFVNAKEETTRFAESRKRLGIKVGSDTDLITSLSGGNQQKVILSRWLENDAQVYLMDNPTQGIDVGAKFSIYTLIVQLASQGKGVVVFTSEYPEIHQLADRCIVLYKGRVAATLDREQLSEVAIMEYSTGTRREVLN
ncbi:MAG: sugar ABC transporter ATP-binding protein [Sphaerochaeta sp.]|jgi:ribose transport system ATP-binding protein|uniref:sugar ABC transporter ATP-binding protein n=1 Tax=Sphaerochaeta sp. TaxID=1972642 RepID=UPI002FC8579A